MYLFYDILIISHIPNEIIKTPVYEIVPFPDEFYNILMENTFDKFCIYEDKVFNKNTDQIIFDKCIFGIIKQEPTQEPRNRPKFPILRTDAVQLRESGK